MPFKLSLFDFRFSVFEFRVSGVGLDTLFSATAFGSLLEFSGPPFWGFGLHTLLLLFFFFITL